MPVSLYGYQKELVFHKQSREWERLQPEYRDGPIVRIPADQFCEAAIVPDKSFILTDDKLAEADGALISGGTLVLLESPHKHEYSYKPSFSPLEPLRGSRRQLEDHLPAVIEVAKRLRKIEAVGDAVTLSNPVQLQCSLHRLTNGEGRILRQVRNAVWRELFRLAPIRANFLERLAAYRPALIINGCTSRLRTEVVKALSESTYGAIIAQTDHPSCWNDKTAARIK